MLKVQYYYLVLLVWTALPYVCIVRCGRPSALMWLCKYLHHRTSCLAYEWSMHLYCCVYTFGLTVSEAKTEIMSLRAKGRPGSTATFCVEAAGKVYNQTNEFVYLGGNVNHNADLSIEVCRRMRNVWCSFRKYTLGLYDRPSAPLKLKLSMLKAEVLEKMLYGCVTWSPRACHYDTLRRAHHRFSTRCIGWRKHNRADHTIFYLDTLVKTESESLEATLRRRRILFMGFVARMGRIRHCRSA